MSLPRTHRLLKLIALLQAGRGFNTDELATACGVTRRTVFRDLDLLRKSGFRLKLDPREERYCVIGDGYLPPLDFTAEEALALSILCHELGNARGLPFLAPARRAAIKLESNLPGALRKQLRSLAGAVEIHAAPNNPLAAQGETYQQLLASISRGHRVRIQYHSLAERQDICTLLSPYRLLFSRRSWYVIGRSSLHRGTRTFNVSRIMSIAAVEESFRVPRGFSLERYLRNAWHLIPERGPDREVLIRFSPLVAENVAEVRWHKTQRVRFDGQGCLEFRAKVSGLNEIAWWILGYADQAEVLEPPELRRIVADRAARTAAKYANLPALAPPTYAPAPLRSRGNIA
jgi:predicted DNA-binding transcriptional regulator YafY